VKKNIFIIIGIIAVVTIGIFLFRGSEDNWIKDSRGVYVKHGNPSKIPNKVADQQLLISRAGDLYKTAKQNNTKLDNGPCLGAIDNGWVADIVHNPRTDVDNKSENQCDAKKWGNAKHFIELDLNGEVVRVK